MRVLVDTSVWSLALRRKRPKPAPEVEALSELIAEGRVAMLGTIRQEILSGIRFAEQFDRLNAVLSAIPDEALSSEDFVEAARLCNRCISSGIVAGNTDCLICSVAISREMKILTTDKDFVHILRIVPVELYSGD